MPSTDYLWTIFRKDGIWAQCRVCFKKIKRGGGSTSSMHYHAKAYHQDAVEHVKRYGYIPRSESSVADFFESTKKLTNEKTKRIRDAQLSFITCNNLSLRILQSDSYVKLCKELNSSYEPITPIAFKSHMMEKVQETSSMIKEKMKNRKISLTLDEWSLLKKEVSVLAIRTFFRTENEKISYTLACLSMSGGHTAEDYLQHIEDCFMQYNIDPVNVISFTTDGGAAVKKAIKLWKDRNNDLSYWVHCIAHRIHLTLTNSLRFSSIYTRMESIFQRLNGDLGSSWRNQKIYKEFCINFCEADGLPPKYVSTRWNSLAVFVRHILLQKKSVIAYQLSRSLPLIDDQMWSFMSTISGVFQSFEKRSKYCSRENAVMSEAYASLIEARRQLANLRSDTFQIELNELLHKFDTYFKEEFETEQTQKILFVDPRIAFDENMYDQLQWMNIADLFGGISIDPQPSQIEYDHPLGVFGAQSVSEIAKYKTYVTGCRPPQNLDIFVWWRDHKKTFPTLYEFFVRNSIVAPTSTDVERLFSTATWLYSQKRRNKLSVATSTQLLFLSSNLHKTKLSYPTSLAADEVNDSNEEEEYMLNQIFKPSNDEDTGLTQSCGELAIRDVSN